MKKIICQIIGITLMSLGVAVTLNTQLGAFPYDANNWFIFKLLNETLPLWVVISFAGLGLCLINIAFSRDLKKFSSLIMVVAMSILIEAFNYLLGFLSFSDPWYLAVPISILGIAVLATGTNFIIIANRLKSPIEDAMLLLNQKTKNIFFARLILELFFLSIAVLTGILSDQLFTQINLFTALNIIFISSFISWTAPLVHFITKEPRSNPTGSSIPPR